MLLAPYCSWAKARVKVVLVVHLGSLGIPYNGSVRNILYVASMTRLSGENAYNLYVNYLFENAHV